MNQAAQEVRERAAGHEATARDEATRNQAVREVRERTGHEGPSMGETVEQAEMGTCSVEYAKRPMDNGRHQKNAGRKRTHDVDRTR